MGNLYPGTSVSGYNANPPPDDGTSVPTNLITWAGIKTKLGDPLNVFASAIDANLSAAFGKTVDGATVVNSAVNYNAGAADQGRLIRMTGSNLTFTCPDTTVVGQPFVMAVSNDSATALTIACVSAQTIEGQTTQVIQPGSAVIIKSDGSNWFSVNGLKTAQISTSGSQFGFQEVINLRLNASVNAGILTVAVKTVAGNDPSPGDPVLVAFRDVVQGNGDPVWFVINSATSINTNAIGATLGTQNSGFPFRFWIVLCNTGAAPCLGLWHSGAGSAAGNMFALNEDAPAATTGISAAATSPGVIYTPNGTSLGGNAFRIIGHLDYQNGLTTAGNYTAAPSLVQLLGPGNKRPGEVVQQQIQRSTTTLTASSGANTFQATSTAVTITLSNSCNQTLVRASGWASSQLGTVIIGRNSSANVIAGPFGLNASAAIGVPVMMEGSDLPASGSAITYTVYIAPGTGVFPITWLGVSSTFTQQSFMIVQEIMA